MVTETTTGGRIHRISGALHRHPRLRLALLLGLPLLWLVGVYGGSLIALLSQSFFSLDDFSGTIDRTLTLETWGDLFTDSNISIAIRTATMAAAVTVGAAILAFPIAYYAVRYAGRRLRAVFFVLILIPLWSSYLVRVYSWKLILAREGILFWFVDKLNLNFLLDAALSAPGIGGPSLSASALGQFVVFTYIWLPYMILPIHAALERVPRSYLEASADLGATPLQTFRTVIWPLAIPGIAAGSIFTFSLTLGDYIIPTIIGDSSPFVGWAIYSYQGVAGNLPLAAAFTFFPIVIMGIYLYVARRAGAFEAL
ncbi:MAG: spermidine/putrescine ABC transporter permease [Actinobacteria bacterium RBG_16_67_15]|nr:MAG: spermidine/putrescine ABC transporter permease [Actinobacteria bacterium RBG_16_67_15]